MFRWDVENVRMATCTSVNNKMVGGLDICTDNGKWEMGNDIFTFNIL